MCSPENIQHTLQKTYSLSQINQNCNPQINNVATYVQTSSNTCWVTVSMPTWQTDKTDRRTDARPLQYAFR